MCPNVSENRTQPWRDRSNGNGVCQPALAVIFSLLLVLSMPAVGATSGAGGSPPADRTGTVAGDGVTAGSTIGTETPPDNGTGGEGGNTTAVRLDGSEAIEMNGVRVGTGAQRAFQRGERTQVFLRLPSVEPSRTVADGADREAVVAKLKRGAERSQRPVLAALDDRDWVTVENTYWIANAILVEIDTEAVSGPAVAVRRLSRLPNLDRVHANHRLDHPAPVPGDGGSLTGPGDTSSGSADTKSNGGAEYTWALDQLNVPDVREEFGANGEGVDVVVLDTGVSPAHPDIEVDGWADFDGEGGRLGAIPFDADGHGTHVSGIIAGNGTAGGEYYGVAPEVNLHVGNVRVPPTLGDRENATIQLSAVLSGLEWAQDEVGADVLTMSLGFADPFSFEDDFIEPIGNSLDGGTVVVASIGNNGPGTSSSPGNEFDTIGVGGTTVGENVAGFSSGDQVNKCDFFLRPALCPVPDHWPDNWIEPSVVAPGYRILSAEPQTGYTELSGTSMAAPHVAGVVALLLSKDGSGTVQPGYVKELLEDTARTPSSPSDPAFNITDVDIDGSIQTNEAYLTEVTVENTGDREAAKVAYEVFDDGLIGGEWRLASTGAVSDVTLGSGEQRTLSLPGKHSTTGQYDVRVRVLPPDQYETRTDSYQLLELGAWDDVEERTISVDPGSSARDAANVTRTAGTAASVASTANAGQRGITPTQHQGSSTRYGHGIVDAYAAFVSEIDAAFVDVTVGTAAGYQQGETVDATVEVTNTGNLTNEFFVGHSVVDATGEVYDNGDGTGTTVELEPGASKTVSVPWTVETDSGGDAPADTYDSVLKVWAESDQDDVRNAVATHTVNDAFTVLPPGENVTFTITDVDGRAGGVDSPRPVEVTVDVQADSEPYSRELDDELFDITVGSKSVASEVLVERVRPGGYRLRFVPPAQSTAGEYDLDVALADVTGDSRADAITYGEGERTQIASALTIDISGSMSGILNEAKEGAVTFVQRADDTDHVSLVAYETASRIEHPLVELADGRESVISAIDGLGPEADTNIGGALTDGLETLEEAPEGSITTGVLMTDGKRTAGPSESEILNDIVPEYNSRGICLYTIGFTDDADEAFMQEIASASDCGDYRFAGEEGEVDSIQNTLQAVFSDIEGDVADTGTFRSDSGTLDPGESYGNEAGIDDSVAQTTVQIRIEGVEFAETVGSASSGTLSATGVDPTVSEAVSLRRPDGTEVDGSSPLVDVSAVGDSVIYRIEDPLPGEWTYSLANPRSQSSEFAVDVTGDAQATLTARTAGDTYYVGEATELVASLIGPEGRISGATAEATVAQPDGSSMTVDLSESSPGIYRGLVPAEMSGNYTATVRAEDGSLSREQTHHWTVEQDPPLSIDQQFTPTIVRGTTGTFDLLVEPATSGSLAGAADLTVDKRHLTDSVAAGEVQPADANFRLSDLEPETPTVSQGEDIQPKVFLVNDGDEPATQTVEYRIDGTVVAKEDIQLDPGYGGWIGLSEPIPIERNPGQYSHGFYSADDSDTGTITVRDQFGITLDVSGLTTPDGGARIPGSAVDIEPQSVTSESSSTVTASVAVPAETPPGEYHGTATAYTSDGRVVVEPVTVVVGRQATFDVEILNANSPVEPGEDIEVELQVTNTAGAGAEKGVTLTVPGVGSRTVDVGLDGGESSVVTITVPTSDGDSGTYDAVITSEDDTVSTAVAVQRPANVAVTAAETNAPVPAGDTLTVNATVENTGVEQGTRTLRLLIGNDIRDATSITLDAGDRQSVTLNWETAADDGGEYTYRVQTGDDAGQGPVTVGTTTPGWATDYVDEDGVATLDGALAAISDYESDDLSLDRVLLVIESYEQDRPIHDLLE